MENSSSFSVNEGKNVKNTKEKNFVKYSKYKKRGLLQGNMSNRSLQNVNNKLGKSLDIHEHDSCWNAQDKICSVLSEPTFCGFSTSGFGYPFEQMAVPVYPVIPAAQFTTHCSQSLHSTYQRKKNKGIGIFKRQEQYTSLPPGFSSDCGKDHRRRFSDPGLINPLIIENYSSHSSLTENELIHNEDIHKENERLKHELIATREELHALKSVVNGLVELHPYPAGTLSGMVKEIEGALELREEAFFLRTQKMVNDMILKMEEKLSFQQKKDEKKTSTEEWEDIKKNLDEMAKENGKTTLKLIRLEETLQNDIVQRLGRVEEIIVNRNFECSSTGIKSTLGSHSSENKTSKKSQEGLEIHRSNDKGFSSSRMKQFFQRASSLSVDENEKGGNSTALLTSEAFESLSSGISPATLHSPIVTMSGPVTDV